LADTFGFHENEQNQQTRLLQEFLFGVLQSSTSAASDKLITKLSRFFHPDKCNSPEATDFFKLFQFLKDDKEHHRHDPEDKKPWLLKVPSQIKEVFVHHFFELLETNISSAEFNSQLDILVTLAAMTSNNDLLRETYAKTPIKTLLINGLNIIKEKDFNELSLILTSKYTNFEEIFNNSIPEEEKNQYAYLYDLLKEFQTFDRCPTRIDPLLKVQNWFEQHGQYKEKLETEKIEANKDYSFANNVEDQQRVAAAVILKFYDLEHNEALFCSKEQFAIINQIIQSWSHRVETYNQMGYSNFKDYKKNYEDLYYQLKTTLGNEETKLFKEEKEEESNLIKQQRKIAISINDFLEKNIFDFIDALFILDNKAQFNKEKISTACLFCLQNKISPQKMVPTEDRGKKLWTKNISSFDHFIEQYQIYQTKYPSFFQSDTSQEIKAQIILRCIELEKKDSMNSKACEKILANPLFENKIEVIDNYFRYNASDKRSFFDYISSITAATDKYNHFNEKLVKDNETLSSLVITEDNILQIIPKNNHPQFKNFLKEMIDELKLADPDLNEVENNAFFKNKISFLKALLDCYMIPFELENRAKHMSCIPQQISFTTLQQTITAIKENLIQERWLNDTPNPELLFLTQDWIKNTVKANLLNIVAQPFDELKENNVDNEVKNKKMRMHFSYFNHYLNFVTQYYLIIRKTDILDSFDTWLAASSQKDPNKKLFKTNTSLPFSENHTSEDPKNNVKLLKPIINLLQVNNPSFSTNFTETTDIATEIETEAQRQLHRSWKFKVQWCAQAVIQVGLLQLFSQNLGSKLARAFINLDELKNKRHYDQACKHYGIDKITDPNKKMFIKDRLKDDYDQYSHAERLQQAVLAAAPFFNNARLQKHLPYF
jgi:hypothetical protein